MAGVRTPISIHDMHKTFPECTRELFTVFNTLEQHYADMQDIEFTIQKNKLFILQTRNGKRTAKASIKIAVRIK